MITPLLPTHSPMSHIPSHSAAESEVVIEMAPLEAASAAARRSAPKTPRPNGFHDLPIEIIDGPLREHLGGFAATALRQTAKRYAAAPQLRQKAYGGRALAQLQVRAIAKQIAGKPLPYNPTTGNILRHQNRANQIIEGEPNGYDYLYTPQPRSARSVIEDVRLTGDVRRAYTTHLAEQVKSDTRKLVARDAANVTLHIAEQAFAGPATFSGLALGGWVAALPIRCAIGAAPSRRAFLPTVTDAKFVGADTAIFLATALGAGHCRLTREKLPDREKLIAHRNYAREVGTALKDEDLRAEISAKYEHLFRSEAQSQRIG